MDAEPPKKLLVVRLGALGDVVHVLPALEAIRAARPGLAIHWAVETACATLLEGHPSLAKLHVIPRKELSRDLRNPARWPSVALRASASVRALRAEGFDAAIDFQGNLRSATVAWLSGAPRRIGFGPSAAKEKAHLLCTHVWDPPDEPRHKAEWNLGLLSTLGIEAAFSPPKLPSSFRGSTELRSALRRYARPLVSIHAGVSRFGALKGWVPDRFAEVGRAVLAKAGGTALYTFGPGEREEAQRLASRAGEGAEAAPESGSLADLVEIFRASDAVVGVDTGPMQLAAAAGKPVVSLFGPKDPARYRPLGAQVRVLTADASSLPCLPCNGRRCPRADARGLSPCMTALSAQEVAEAVLGCLGF